MQRKKKNIKKLFNWRMKQNSGMQSTQTNVEESKSSVTTLSTDIPLPALFHRSCKTLLYDTFLNIIDSGSLSLLVIHGQPSIEELVEAWGDILQEHSELIKSNKTQSISDLFKKITYTEWKIVFLEKGLWLLKHEYNEKIATDIANMGYDLIVANDDRETYLRQIYGVETDAKFLIVQLNQYKTEYSILCPKDQQVKTLTLIDYERDIAILSKFMGYRINKKEITVFEFDGIVNYYLETVQKEKQK